MAKSTYQKMHFLTEEELDRKIAEANSLAPLPNYKESEEAVLGAILLDKDAFSIVNKILTPKHFYNNKFSVIYQAAINLDTKRIPIDILTVTQEIIKMRKILDYDAVKNEREEIANSKRMTIKKKKRLAELDNQSNNYPSSYEIVDVTNRVASSANIEAHSYILHECFLKREAIINCKKALEKIYDPTTDIIEVRNEIAQSMITSSKKNTLIFESATERQIRGSKMPARPQLMGSLIRKGDITFIFAEPKTGKTVFTYQMADRISKGQGLFWEDKEFDFFDDSENVANGNYLLPNFCDPMKTLYYDFEMEADEMHERTSLQGNDRWHQFNDNIYFVSENPDFHDYSDNYFLKREKEIIQYADIFQPECIVLDNMTALTIESLSDARVAKKVSFLVKGLKHRYKGCTIICLAHTPKRYNKHKPIDNTDMRGAAALGDITKNLIAIGKCSFDDDLYYIKHIFARNTLKQFDKDNVISCRITDQNSMLSYEVIELTEESKLLSNQLGLFNDEEIDEKALLEEGYQMYYLECFKYPEIAKVMQEKIHWSLSQWRRKIRKYAQEHTSWNGQGEVPRAEPKLSKSSDSDFNEYPGNWDSKN